jgi:hypothetical protein
MDIFNYDTSWLNPALKILVTLGYLAIVPMFFFAARYFKGDLRKIFKVLVWLGVIGCLAALIRYFGDGLQFGFTKSHSLKWFQSIGYLAQAIVFTIIAWKFSRGKVIPEIKE